MAKKQRSRTAVLVMGMHRSGTSALAGSLQRLQVPLGSRLVAPGEDNPGGYFEHAGAVTTHETLLAELDNGWESLLPLPTNWIQSAAAERAASELGDLISVDFGNAVLWAVKDPRLSRLLPLWHQVLAKQEVRPVHVFMLRHPDEVAASLAKRDGIGAGYAYLLWLQHYLDAERDSRGYARAVLTYDQLLADPVGSLGWVAEVLGVRWPVPPAQGGVGEILDSSKRHHLARIDAPGRGARAAALELFSEVQSASRSGQWPRGESQRRLLERWTNRLIPWIGGLSRTLARQRRVAHQAAEQHQATDQALAEAQDLSLQRLRDLTEGEARIRRSEQLALIRLQELEGMAARLAQTDAALAATEAQSLSRLEELEVLSARLAQTDAALAATESQSLSRLQELEVLSARLAQTDAALAATEAQSVARLRDIEALWKRVEATDEALAHAEHLSTDRLQESEGLRRMVSAANAALASAETIAMSRLRDLEVVSTRLSAANASLADTIDKTHQLEAQISLRDEKLQALTSSLSWRVSRPLRWLGRRTGRRGEGWETP